MSMYATRGSRGNTAISVCEDENSNNGLLDDFLEDGSRRRLKKMRSQYQDKVETLEIESKNVLDRVRQNSKVSDQQRWIRCRMHWFGESDQPPVFENRSDVDQYVLENHFGDEFETECVDQSDASSDVDTVQPVCANDITVQRAPVSTVQLAFGSSWNHFPNSSQQLDEFEDYRLSSNRNTVWNLRLTAVNSVVEKNAVTENTAGANSAAAAVPPDAASLLSSVPCSDGKISAACSREQTYDHAVLLASLIASSRQSPAPHRVTKFVPMYELDAAWVHLLDELLFPDPRKSTELAGEDQTLPADVGDDKQTGEQLVIDCAPAPDLELASMPALLPMVIGPNEEYRHVQLMASLKTPVTKLHELRVFVPFCEPDAAWIHLLEV